MKKKFIFFALICILVLSLVLGIGSMAVSAEVVTIAPLISSSPASGIMVADSLTPATALSVDEAPVTGIAGIELVSSLSTANLTELAKLVTTTIVIGLAVLASVILLTLQRSRFSTMGGRETKFI